MSANIPFEIQTEIIKRVLPVKSLIRFRSVSKQWKSLIDSSEFINHHSVNQTHQQHLLVRYNEADGYNKYVSVVDDDSFPHHKFFLDLPPTVKLVNHPLMLDCSHGLVCFYGNSAVHGKTRLVVWNPSIRKSVGIFCSPGFTAIGFGVCPETFETKIVQISVTGYMDLKWKAEVYTITSGSWRSIPMNIHMPQNQVSFSSNQVLINGVIHWLVSNFETRYIVSFDLTSEEFGKIYLPENLVRKYLLSVSKLKESLLVVDYDITVCDVWMLIKNGDSNFLFEKLYTINCCTHDGYDCDMYPIHVYKKNGQPIMEHTCMTNDSLITKLEVYEPSTSCTSDLVIFANSETVSITSYTESLILLNHSESIIQE